MIWTIDKQFEFCFGHRVHNQSLDTQYSLDGCLACRHLHGHQGVMKLFLQANKLVGGMVTDFKHTNIFKQWVDDVMDHKFIIDINDPLMPHECPEYCVDGELDLNKCIHNEYGFWVPDMSHLDNSSDDANIKAIYEKYEGMVFVDFVPTSENLCAWWLEVANKMLNGLGVDVYSVEYWETPKSHCKVTK